MGFWDFLEDIVDGVDDFIDGIGELANDIEDTKDEINEILTDGVYEVFVKNNDNYKTSYEKKSEANLIIAEQSDKYNDKYNELKEVTNKLNKHIELLHQKKIKILGELYKLNSPTMLKLNDTKPFSAPVYNKDKTYMLLEKILGLDKYIGILAKKSYANEYLENALDFEAYISGLIADINRIETKICAVEQMLKEEDMLLDALEKSISTKRELKHHNIAIILNKLISEYVLNQSGDTNSVYVSAIEELKELCCKY